MKIADIFASAYEVKRLRDELAKTKYMLEMALHDLAESHTCTTCANRNTRTTEEPCRGCYGGNWQWRGEKYMHDA